MVEAGKTSVTTLGIRLPSLPVGLLRLARWTVGRAIGIKIYGSVVNPHHAARLIATAAVARRPEVANDGFSLLLMFLIYFSWFL